VKKRPFSVVAILVLFVGGMALSVRAESWSDQDLEAALQIEFMRGHLISMVETGKLGRWPQAKLHAGHPRAEHFSKLPAVFRDTDLGTTLRRALEQLRTTGGRDGVAAEKASELLTRAYDVFVPAAARQSTQFRSILLAGLLKEVAEEYEEAVGAGKVKSITEYQDAYGFFQRALLLKEGLEASLTGEESVRLDGVVRTLQRAFRSVRAPLTPMPNEEVAEAVKIAVRLIEERVARKP